MTRHQYVVLTVAKKGREAEFETWYDDRHIADVVQVPGVVSAQRFHISFQKVTGINVPQWTVLAIYEIESDEPEQVMKKIAERADTEVMPLTGAMDRTGMVQLIAQLSRAVTRN